VFTKPTITSTVQKISGTVLHRNGRVTIKNRQESAVNPLKGRDVDWLHLAIQV